MVNPRAFLIFVLAALIVAALSFQGAAAQDPTITPLVIVPVTRTATPVPEISATPTRTPTVGVSSIKVEAPVEANVRTAPDLSAQVLGKIYPGQFFAVLGRRAKWLQIQYPGSPTGLAWVFEDVVKISGGDPEQIQELNVDAVPSPNVETAAAQQTAAFITETPGAPGSATAAQASATGVFTLVADGGSGKPPPGVPLPTFTYPPPFVEATLPARVGAVTTGGLPPIVPIIGLGVLGLAGLFIATLRRGR